MRASRWRRRSCGLIRMEGTLTLMRTEVRWSVVTLLVVKLVVVKLVEHLQC